jgi:hypothetical protein
LVVVAAASKAKKKDLERRREAVLESVEQATL